MEVVHSGKVRDLYADGDDIILVASDRVSVYDVILPTPIPDKGKILTQLSLWWFGQLAGVVPNHVVSASDVPPEWAGRAIRVRRLEMIPVECIARGYLAGLGLASYQASGTISGVSLPPGLTEGAKLPEPVFTPTTKAAAGHDEPLTYDETAAALGPETAAALQADHAGDLSPGRRSGGGMRRHHRRHETRIRPRGGWFHRPRRRSAHARLVAILAGFFLGPGTAAAFPGQTVPARLVGHP